MTTLGWPASHLVRLKTKSYQYKLSLFWLKMEGPLIHVCAVMTPIGLYQSRQGMLGSSIKQFVGIHSLRIPLMA